MISTMKRSESNLSITVSLMNGDDVSDMESDYGSDHDMSAHDLSAIRLQSRLNLIEEEMKSIRFAWTHTSLASSSSSMHTDDRNPTFVSARECENTVASSSGRTQQRIISNINNTEAVEEIGSSIPPMFCRTNPSLHQAKPDEKKIGQCIIMVEEIHSKEVDNIETQTLQSADEVSVRTSSSVDEDDGSNGDEGSVEDWYTPCGDRTPNTTNKEQAAEIRARAERLLRLDTSSPHASPVPYTPDSSYSSRTPSCPSQSKCGVAQVLQGRFAVNARESEGSPSQAGGAIIHEHQCDKDLLMGPCTSVSSMNSRLTRSRLTRRWIQNLKYITENPGTDPKSDTANIPVSNELHLSFARWTAQEESPQLKSIHLHDATRNGQVLSPVALDTSGSASPRTNVRQGGEPDSMREQMEIVQIPGGISLQEKIKQMKLLIREENKQSPMVRNSSSAQLLCDSSCSGVMDSSNIESIGDTIDSETTCGFGQSMNSLLIGIGGGNENTSLSAGGSSPLRVTRMPFTDTYGDDGWFTGEVDSASGLPHGQGTVHYCDGRMRNGFWTNGLVISPQHQQDEQRETTKDARGTSEIGSLPSEMIGYSIDSKTTFGSMNSFPSISGMEGHDDTYFSVGESAPHFVTRMPYSDIYGCNGMYTGEVVGRSGLPHGQGTLYYCDGRIRSGLWTNGLAGLLSPQHHQSVQQQQHEVIAAKDEKGCSDEDNCAELPIHNEKGSLEDEYSVELPIRGRSTTKTERHKKRKARVQQAQEIHRRHQSHPANQEVSSPFTETVASKLSVPREESRTSAATEEATTSAKSLSSIMSKPLENSIGNSSDVGLQQDGPKPLIQRKARVQQAQEIHCRRQSHPANQEVSSPFTETVASKLSVPREESRTSAATEEATTSAKSSSSIMSKPLENSIGNSSDVGLQQDGPKPLIPTSHGDKAHSSDRIKAIMERKQQQKRLEEDECLKDKESNASGSSSIFTITKNRLKRYLRTYKTRRKKDKPGSSHVQKKGLSNDDIPERNNPTTSSQVVSFKTPYDQASLELISEDVSGDEFSTGPNTFHPPNRNYIAPLYDNNDLPPGLLPLSKFKSSVTIETTSVCPSTACSVLTSYSAFIESDIISPNLKGPESDDTTRIINLLWTEDTADREVDAGMIISGRYTGPINKEFVPNGEGKLLVKDINFHGQWVDGNLITPLTIPEDESVNSETDKDNFKSSDLQEMSIRYILNKGMNKSIKGNTTSLLKPMMKYLLGDACRTPKDMIIKRINIDAVHSTSLLMKWGQCFVKRSNGVWTMAIMVDRGLQPRRRRRNERASWRSVWDIDSTSDDLEEAMLFVINEDAGTKIIGRSCWGKFVRQVRDDP